MNGIDNPVAMGGMAVFATLAIQALKNSGWATWFNRETDRANLALSIAVACITTMGIHITSDALGNFAVSGNWHLVTNAALQWLGQHTAYKGLVVPAETLGEIRALLQRILQPPISQPEAKAQDAKDGSIPPR